MTSKMIRMITRTRTNNLTNFDRVGDGRPCFSAEKCDRVLSQKEFRTVIQAWIVSPVEKDVRV